MPVVAIGFGIWGGAALIGGGLTVLGTIAAVGAVGAAVGTVTGNKDLMRFGTVLGLVGGVGALAQSAGVLASSGASEVLATEAGATASGAEQLSGPPPEAPSAPGAVAQETMQNVVPDATPEAPALADATAAKTPLAQTGTPAAEALKGPEQLSGPAPSVVDSVKEYMRPMFEFAQKNQMLTYGMMQIGGSAIQGLFDTTKEAQKQALEARARVDNQQAAYLEQKTRNISAPLPTATSAGARRDVYSGTARPPYNAPAPVGLLNSTVTGRPA